MPRLSRWTWGIIGAIFCLSILWIMLPSLPSDKSLRNHFLNHRAEFDSLLEMAQQDKTVNAIWPNEMEMTGPKSDSSYIPYPPATLGFPADRFAHYQELLKSINAESLIRWEDGSILLGTGGWGFASYGVRWGYIWLPTPPNKAQTIPSMDNLRQSIKNRSSTEAEDFTRFCPLAEQWYIFFRG